MADTPAVPFSLASYRSATRAISGQQIVNGFAELQKTGMDAKAPLPLLGSPGLVSFAAVGAGPIRALIEMQSVLYAVSGSQFYSINSSGTGTLLGGGIAPGSNVLGIAESGSQIGIMDGTKGFSYSVASGYAAISDTDCENSKTIAFLNSYFLREKFGTNEWISSDSDDVTSYDALFFSNAETNPDNAEAVLSHQQQAWITGKKGIETWQFNPNTSGFPWVRYPGAGIKTGVAGPFAATVHKDDFFYVGSDWLFYKLEGGQPVCKSDPGVAKAWKAYGDISDVVVWGLTWNKQEQVYITFPSAPATWVYDATTDLFHERESHTSDMVSLSRWRGNVHATCYNRDFIGDAFTNKIGYLSDDAFDEYGDPLRFRAVSPTMHNDGGTIFMSSLEFLMQAGVGLTTGQGSDPKMILDWSDDDGATFSTVNIELSLGAIGDRRRRVRATQMGSFSNRCFRVTITDPVKRCLVAAVPKVKGGLKYS